MQIITVANDIVTFAPEHGLAAAWWLRVDFNFQELWNDKFGPSYTQALCYPYEEYDRIWHRVPAIRPFPEQGTLHRFAPRLAELEFVYLHPNPQAKLGVDPPDRIGDLVWDSLEELKPNALLFHCCEPCSYALKSPVSNRIVQAIYALGRGD